MRGFLDRQSPQSHEPNSLHVKELLENGLPELEDALTSPSLLAEGGLYHIGDWAVCLMLKGPDTLVFKSVETHFQFGHLQFSIPTDLLEKRVVGPNNVFENMDDAIRFLQEVR